MIRSAASLAVVLALLLAQIMPGAVPARGCGQCPPGCPMHAGRLGCHRATAMPCHLGGSSGAIRSACHHAPEPAMQSGSLRGVLPVSARPSPVFTARSARACVRLLVTQHVSETSTEPPRPIA